ncbi:AAA family ATPase [Brucella tritici]|uniref:AAA family ATPase n=1 Tax=Brucella tritici TaxID=94626 RepID=A0A833CI44_9HYPH|nr:toprim domain-containing protein [Brucella tritici]KAB2662756.1 AAA family ATPase [Brucella tritici]
MSEAADTVLFKGPCPDCGSKDNLATYADGHKFCFTPGCGLKQGKARDSEDMNSVSEKKAPQKAVPFTSVNMREGLQKARGLKLDTLQRFGYFVHKEKGKTLQVAPVYNQRGEMVYQKYRDKDKNFWFTEVADNAPKPRMCQLYGQNVWGDKYDRKVVITTGEHDAHSVAEACQFKIPAVSVIAGDGSALEQLKTNYRWLDRFEEIILWFDNDESGQSVVAECAALFEPGRVKTIKIDRVKDANELAKAGRHGDIYAAVWGATLWAPDGIVNAALCITDMEEPEAETICSYPWPIVQDMTKGIREKEVVYHVAGTGIGKTSIIVELQEHLLLNNVKFGVMRFEDTRRKAQLDLMSVRANRRLHINPIPKEELKALHTSVFGGGLVELFDPEVAEWSFAALERYIRYMVKGLDCKVIFIDPLSFIVAAVDAQDERKALDKVSYNFARLVKQTGANLQITHHLNRGEGKAFEEGGQISLKNIRGSAGVANFSMGVHAYERNQQGERPDLTRTRILKNRHVGRTGVADTLMWHEDIGRQLPTDEPYPDSNSDKEAPAFGPINNQGDY